MFSSRSAAARRIVSPKDKFLCRRTPQNTNNTNQTNGAPPPDPPIYRFNALKHGLTAKTLIFHLSEIPFYEQCVATIVGFYNPVSDMEKLVVQEIADTNWRLLRRLLSYESGFFAKGRAEAASLFQNMVPEEQRSFICDADTAHIYSKSLTNLSLQQSRTHSSLEKRVKEFEKMRDERDLVEQTRRDLIAKTLLSTEAGPVSPLVDSVFSSQFLRARQTFKNKNPEVPLRIFDLAWGDPKAKTIN